MRNDDFEALSAQILTRVENDDRVIGLVMLGSAADASRRDEWSDHDFFLITNPGDQEAFRTDFWWIADADDIAGYVRETAHGVQVFLTNGHLLEFAVFDADEIGVARVNARAVLLDKADINARIEAVATEPGGRPIVENMTLFLSHIGTGIGRYRRGEVIAARTRLLAVAVPNLLLAVLQHREIAAPDGLDVTRRIEDAIPDIAEGINEALGNADLEVAGQQLLGLAERELGHRPDFPWPVDASVRRRLGYSVVRGV